ncbi:SseB family protein [Streptomyces caeruleatus]|uniref:SseB family protein n=1 Tax=Streptomyces caeruleatus TaxID=661399 RepID=UPI000AD6AD42|nr:SseB family protein [Streptomyces caeruleatus]
MSADALRLLLTDLAETGHGDLRAAVGEFRRSEVRVPVEDDSVVSVEAGGIRWLFAFTDDAALARFAEARGETLDERVLVYGAWLLDRVIPRVGGPVGIAVDAGSATGMALPPAAGIVPDSAVAVAVPVAVEGTGVRGAGA